MLVINENNEIALLKQNYISKTHWGVVSGYVKNGDTLEETAQHVERMEYVTSYYFKPKELIMSGFIAFVNKRQFASSNEVDDIMWCKIEDVNKYIARHENMSGIHFDNCMKILKLNES